MSLFIKGMEMPKGCVYRENGHLITCPLYDIDGYCGALNEEASHKEGDMFYKCPLVPAADVRENVRGEWLNLADLPIATVNWSPSEVNYRVCSNCYKNKDANCGYKAWHKDRATWMAFCPTCGADMRGLTNDE